MIIYISYYFANSLFARIFAY